MDDRALMQMALDAMESFESGTNGLYRGEFAEERKALRERLAQPDYKQTRLNLCGVCGWDAVVPGEGCLNCKRLIKPENNADYERGFIDGRQDQMRSSVDKAVNRMARREWVGLTDEEIKEIVGPWGETPIKGYTRKLFDSIEAKLKEKNV